MGGRGGGEERWIVVFVGQCVAAAAGAEGEEEQKEEKPTKRTVTREASHRMLA